MSLGRYSAHMADLISVDMFRESARAFAESALRAHHAGDSQRVALDAGMALEHLAKACLCSRSPALLVDLRGDQNFVHLLRLLQIPEGKSPRPLRTVGLRGALERVARFVTSSASNVDLGTLVDMRDGTVHAAQDNVVEERLLVAFVQYADALLADLGWDRAEFWDGQLAVVDALLADASDKVEHEVAVKVAAASAKSVEVHASWSEPETAPLMVRPTVLPAGSAMLLR